MVTSRLDDKAPLIHACKDRWLTKDYYIVVVFTPDDAGRIEAFLAKIPSKTLASGKRLNVAHGQSTPLAPGPYVFDCLTGNLYRPDRLFKDTSNAFVRGALPVGGMATGMGYSSDMYQCLEVSDVCCIASHFYLKTSFLLRTKKRMISTNTDHYLNPRCYQSRRNCTT